MADRLGKRLLFVAGAYFDDFDERRVTDSEIVFFSTTHDRKIVNRAWKHMERLVPADSVVFFFCWDQPNDTFKYRVVVASR